MIRDLFFCIFLKKGNKDKLQKRKNEIVSESE